jgi:hypothetical protein
MVLLILEVVEHIGLSPITFILPLQPLPEDEVLTAVSIRPSLPPIA